jgi:hypothetical protein
MHHLVNPLSRLTLTQCGELLLLLCIERNWRGKRSLTVYRVRQKQKHHWETKRRNQQLPYFAGSDGGYSMMMMMMIMHTIQGEQITTHP